MKMEENETKSELNKIKKKQTSSDVIKDPEEEMLEDCKKQIYILLEFYDRLYSLLSEIFDQRIRRWSPPNKDVGLIYLRMCRFIEIRLRILESDLGYLWKIGILPEEIDFQAVDDPDINIFYEIKEMKWFPFEHIINVNRDDWEKNGKKICGDFLGKVTKLWLSFKKEPGEVYKISDSNQLELLKSVENVIKHYRKLDRTGIRLIENKRKSGIRRRIRLPEKFPAPPNTVWNMVKIQFVSKDSVRISVESIHRRYTFAEMGFKDNRKGDLPDTQWEVLRYLAKNNGELSWQKETAMPNAQKRIQEIRKRLRTFMGIKEDPFFPYRENKSYKTKFNIEDKSYD